jgi:DNA-binding NarL/FixJ family response regulator
VLEAILEKSTLRVLIVDDYEPFRQFIATKLQTNPQLRIVKEACDGGDAVQQAQELQPDLILLDIGLPTLNGIEAARRIRKVSPASKIVFVTENRSTDTAEEALRTGASGYVVKSDAATQLLLAVDAVLQGKQFVSGSLTGHSLAGPGNEHAEPLRREQMERHGIKFYPDNASLVHDFAQFTEGALKIGNAVVVIATESLRADILQTLRTNGVDPSATAGRYFPLDVSDPLSTSAVGAAAEEAILEGLHFAVG